MKENFLELAKRRFSVRSFSSKPVEEEKLQLILEAAAIAPTACNKQPVRIIIPDRIERLSSIKPLFGAPTAFIICYDDRLSWKNRHDGDREGGEIDVAIVTTHMMLEAEELELGTCWIGSFDPAAITKEFGLNSHIHPVAILPVGYPADDCKPHQMHFQRLSPEEFTFIL